MDGITWKATCLFLVILELGLVQTSPFSRRFPECARDGIYYNNPTSFILCSNGRGYEQVCAPGTRNRPPSFYREVDKGRPATFCDINMLGNSMYSYGMDRVSPYRRGYARSAARYDTDRHPNADLLTYKKFAEFGKLPKKRDPDQNPYPAVPGRPYTKKEHVYLPKRAHDGMKKYGPHGKDDRLNYIPHGASKSQYKVNSPEPFGLPMPTPRTLDDSIRIRYKSDPSNRNKNIGPLSLKYNMYGRPYTGFNRLPYPGKYLRQGRPGYSRIYPQPPNYKQGQATVSSIQPNYRNEHAYHASVSKLHQDQYATLSKYSRMPASQNRSYSRHVIENSAYRKLI